MIVSIKKDLLRWNVICEMIHNDHLATPQNLTDNSGTVVWAADYKPFGEVTIDPSSTITNNLRFPGQYYDVETRLNYNYARDYNPMIGRYVEADPVGIKRGKNHLFVYVGNNPVKRKDPLGLDDLSDLDPDGTIESPEGSIFTCRQIAETVLREGRQRHPVTADDRNNHMRHCWASCRVAQLGGSMCAFIAGWYNELRGVYDSADVEANSKGRNCASGDCVRCCQGCQP